MRGQNGSGSVAVVDKIAPCYTLKNSGTSFPLGFLSFPSLVGGGGGGENRRFPQWKVTVQNNRFSSNFKHLPQSVMSGNVEISCSICLQVWNFTHTGVWKQHQQQWFSKLFCQPLSKCPLLHKELIFCC